MDRNHPESELERVMDASNYDGSFNTTANWKLAGGALTDSISFESSFSTSSAKHESEDGIIPAAVDHVAKSPLLLLPPFPNGEPCEITITFAQEHELRQVYIRSTARVYEVYYAKKKGHDQEYLCTVRCGIAMRGEEVHRISFSESAASKSGVEPMERRINDNANGRTNDDDWVQVKAGDASPLNNDKDLLPMPQIRKQDFYEATAEIDDAEPCISITFRLLSLQDKGCAFVDEVYVFADPIDPSESEQEEVNGTGNQSGGSLLAMFMPTILQLSRGKDVIKEGDGQLSNKSNGTNPGTLGNSNDSGKTGNKTPKEINFNKVDYRGVSSPVLVDTLAKHVDATQVYGAEIKPDMPCSNVETILHQLVNKVSWIETTLTRFEDQMLKPINRIDERLQLVEKKLEQLGKKSFESELLVEAKTPNSDDLESNTDITPKADELVGLTNNIDNPQLASCSKIAVPDSSSIDSSEDYAVLQPKNKVDEKFPKLIEPENENNSISRNEMISAESEISNEEVGHPLGRGALEENPRRSVSINDALASALAGLLSSTSITVGGYSQALIVTAPEFSNEEDMEMEKKPSTDTLPENGQVAAEDSGKKYSASEIPTSAQKEPGVTLYIEDDSQNGVSEKLSDNVGGYDDAAKVVIVRNNDLDEETVTSSTRSDSYTERENLSYEPRNPVSLVHELENPNVTIGFGSSRFITAKECKGESEMDNVLKSVLSLQPTTSVDFLSPVLDVKFNSEKDVSDNKCFFEALLLTAESETDVDCNYEACDDNLVSVEDEELTGPPTDTLSSLEMDHYETDEMHLPLTAEIPTASLI